MNDSYHTNDSPEIFEAHWDREQVKDLFNELRSGAEVIHVQVRTMSANGLENHAVTLDQAQQLLDDGGAKMIQIRYHFEGQGWCDTLMVMPQEIRIIRTRDVLFD